MNNLEIIAAHYAASDRGDLPAMLAPLSSDVRWTEAEGFPCAGTYVGPDAVREGVFQRLGNEWDGFAAAMDVVLDAGDTIVGVGTYSGTSKATGKPFEARVAHIWQLVGGKVVAFEQITDTLMVARASGSY
jgi:uncharacterized protein